MPWVRPAPTLGGWCEGMKESVSGSSGGSGLSPADPGIGTSGTRRLYDSRPDQTSLCSHASPPPSWEPTEKSLSSRISGTHPVDRGTAQASGQGPKAPAPSSNRERFCRDRVLGVSSGHF